MSLRPLQIGQLTIEPNLVLAPMSGVTDQSFRRLIKEANPGAVGLMLTEFISVEGLTRHNLQSVRMMDFLDEERPVGIQIFGFDISRMAEGARMAEARGAALIDINCGCPVPKVVKRGGGCQLMRQPEHLAQLLREVRRAVSVPVTLKIRAGWSPAARNALEIAKIAEGEGMLMLTIHGRTREEGYRGKADWQLIDEVARTLSIPVLGSGDVVDGASAELRMQTGVSGLMIGRAALANPWIFREVAAQLAGQALPERRAEDVPKIMQRYSQMLKERLPDKAVIGRLKQFASQVTRLIPGSAPVRKTLCRTPTVNEFVSILEVWAYELAGGGVSACTGQACFVET